MGWVLNLSFGLAVERESYLTETCPTPVEVNTMDMSRGKGARSALNPLTFLKGSFRREDVTTLN